MPKEIYTPQEVTSLMNLVDTYIRWRTVDTRGNRSYDHYHPSEMGKAQPLDSLIQTPFGPVKMGDIKKGDKVCSPNGEIVEVIDIHPQGIKDIYRIKFSDRDEVECCEDHLWEVDSLYLGFVKYKILTTKDLLSRYIARSGHRVFSIRLPEPLKMFSSAPSLIPPYFMGVILGDGCLRCSSLNITSIDHEIIDKVATYIGDDYRISSWRNGVQHRVALKKQEGTVKNRGKLLIKRRSKTNIYKDELRKYGLMGKKFGEPGVKSNERFIPEDYLYVKEEDRWELIRGLMDTDGYICVKGYASFSTASPIMAQQFKWLVESVGGVCYIIEKETTHLLSHTCYIKHKNVEKFFFLKRKKDRARPLKNTPKKMISKIEIIGRKEAQCITVSNPDGLYLTNHCIITHNCLRSQQYKHYAWKGLIDVRLPDPDSTKQRLFDKGHNMHDRWSNYFDKIGGILLGRWRCKNLLCYMFDDKGNVKNNYPLEEIYKDKKTRIMGEKEVGGIFRPKKCVCGCSDFEYLETHVRCPEFNIKGNADIVLNCKNLNEERFKGVRISYNNKFLPLKDSKVVIDMKTCGSNAWKNQIMAKGPHKDYLIQLTIYTHILDCDYGIIAYENKDNSKMAWFQVPRNDEWWEVIKYQTKTMIEMSKNRKLPPPKYSSKSNYSCKWCEFRELCHKSKIWDSPNLNKNRREFYKSLL